MNKPSRVNEEYLTLQKVKEVISKRKLEYVSPLAVIPKELDTLPNWKHLVKVDMSTCKWK